MRRIAWMSAACVGSWLALALVARGSVGEIGYGMVGPLVAAAGSWLMIERTFRRNPSHVTPVMVQSLAVKMIFFAAYVVAGIELLSLRPAAFIVSFTGYFLSLHVVEAVWLRRLFAGAAPAAR